MAAPTSVATRQSLSELSSVLAALSVLKEKKDETIMSKQLLRCGTSIVANVREGQYAQSKKDFISKMNIALKECAETQYWLRLLHRTEFLTDAEFSSLNSDADEIGRILSSIINSAKKTTNNNNNNNNDDVFVIDDEE